MATASDLQLSVIIPSFNTAELTLRCLETLLAELPADSEVIVVDDGSSDGSVQRLQTVAAGNDAVSLLCHDSSQGFSRAANAGMQRARGAVLLLLNSDTEIPAEGLESLLPAFARDPGLGIAGAELCYPDGRPQWSGGAAPSLLWLLMLTSGLPGLLSRLPGYRRLHPVSSPQRSVDWVTGAALAIRRQVWDENGPLDERYRFYCQDLDLCLRVAAGGWQVRQVPGFRVVHHLGASIGKENRAAPSGGVPALLWSDLLLWARLHRGTKWAARAARIMHLGGSIRVLGRRLLTPLVPAQRLASWRQGTAAFRAGVHALQPDHARRRMQS